MIDFNLFKGLFSYNNIFSQGDLGIILPLFSPRLNILFYRNDYIPFNHTFRDRFLEIFPTPMFGVPLGRKHLTKNHWQNYP